ncbi:nucleotidyltransferase family protein [Aliamphritea ceti]|uniref:nucleotidyltransferase family protein n=1 Tax=Aliamphritea ceti TaxID=1524258 RepID=UPI0021C4295A|nr:nucleotidyltransferase family protein [Aliamphritea ceti]
MNIACLLLAAGGSSRFGGRKQLACVGGKSMVQHTLEQLTPVFKQKLYTVIGAYRDEIRPVVNKYSYVIEHAGWEQGLGSSIAEGVNTITRHADYDGILIALADQVMVSQNDYLTLLDTFDGTQIVASSYSGKNAVPALFPAQYFPELQEFNSDSGARALLALHTNAVISVSLPQAETDIDTKQDLTEFTATASESGFLGEGSN